MSDKKLSVFEDPINGRAIRDYDLVNPVHLGGRSDQILPFGLPVGSDIWVADKLDYVFCDGEDHWYRKKDEPVDAGNPISMLFDV